MSKLSVTDKLCEMQTLHYLCTRKTGNIKANQATPCPNIISKRASKSPEAQICLKIENTMLKNIKILTYRADRFSHMLLIKPR